MTSSSLSLSRSIALTAAVLGMDGVAVVTGPAHLAVGPTGVALASETRPRDDITVPRLTHVHIAMALAADAGPTHFLRVPIEAAGAPVGGTDRQTDGLLVTRELSLIGCWAAGPRGSAHLSQLAPV